MPCWKLVRDRIGESVSGSGAVVTSVSGEVLERLLRVKLVEEAVEFASSGSVEEVADIVEVLDAWLRVKGVGWDEVERVRRLKRERLGGFEKGLVVVWPDRDSC